jgi:excisionase family DNA binding protein
MTVRDITDLTPDELRSLLQHPLDPRSRKAVRAEIQRRPKAPPPPPVAPNPGTTPEPLLKPTEVAAIFRVTVDTVRTWANTGKLSCTRTPGGHRRYRAAEVYALRDAPPPAPPADQDGGHLRPRTEMNLRASTLKSISNTFHLHRVYSRALPPRARKAAPRAAPPQTGQR